MDDVRKFLATAKFTRVPGFEFFTDDPGTIASFMRELDEDPIMQPLPADIEDLVWAQCCYLSESDRVDMIIDLREKFASCFDVG